MRIYTAGSITGQSGDYVLEYFQNLKFVLESFGYDVIHPMIAKGYFRNEKKFASKGYVHKPQSTNHAIVERDRWMVYRCDVLYCNLTSAKIVSIGSVMELAWAHHMGKHTVLAMQSDNIHQHAFVLEASDIVFETTDEAIDYLRLLSEKK